MSTNPSHTYKSGKSVDKFSGLDCTTCPSIKTFSHKGYPVFTIHTKRSVIGSGKKKEQKSVKTQGKSELKQEDKKSEQLKPTSGSTKTRERQSAKKVSEGDTKIHGRDRTKTEEKPEQGGSKLKDKKEEKSQFGDALKKRVSALRNTDGGYVLIHVDEQKETDRNLQFFDECMVNWLNSLISDGSIYADNYKRLWLSDYDSAWKDYKDVVLLRVEKANGLVTVDFNSKVRHDHENVPVTTSNIVSILLREKSVVSTGPKPIENLKAIKTEDRHIELKSLNKKVDKTLEKKNETEIADYIWSKLKLKDNISSMSKNQEGGSYILGYGEEKVEQNDMSKIFSLQGIHVDVELDDLKRALDTKIRSNILVLVDKDFANGTEKLYEIKVHHMGDDDVLEVAIGFCKGLVFNDFEGPRTYHIVKDEIERMTKIHWLRKMMENCYMCNQKLGYL